MKTQCLENQRGEIAFRAKLYRQQIDGERIFADEFDAREIETVLADRMAKTRHDMESLKETGIPVSPYIEIGAERGQRSLVMENDMEATGAAIDISYALLRSAAHYQEVFSKPKRPLTICCDANNLPFKSNSVPFVFCYETLHHFPDPAPITHEVHRVLAPGGSFFFDEEPFKQVLHFDLYAAKKSYSKEYLSRNVLNKVLGRFFMRRHCNETEHGILENNKISLQRWRDALAPFDTRDIRLQLGAIDYRLNAARFNLRYLMLWLLGGGISGLCRKPGAREESKHSSILDLLVCPDCLQNGKEMPLSRAGSMHSCSGCSTIYPTVAGVLFLFSKGKLADLYPEMVGLQQQAAS